MLKNILLVGAGGFAGSILRYLAGQLISSGNNFPSATLIVNIAGCFIIGLLFYYVNENDTAKLLLATGFCGGFTTFSAFSLENIKLLQNNQYISAVVYILLSIVLGLCATGLGIYLSKKIFL